MGSANLSMVSCLRFETIKFVLQGFLDGLMSMRDSHDPPFTLLSLSITVHAQPGLSLSG